MAQRTNLITRNNPIKYVFASVLLLGISGIGIFWLFGNKENSKNLITENNSFVSPTIELIPTEKITTQTARLSTIPTTIKNISASPSAETLISYENKENAFLVKYDSKRKLTTENEASGKRYIFSNPLGNITVHAGKSWSWVNSGRTFTDKLLVGGEKSYVYEISNQKIVDIEKGNLKYTIQCVHNTLKDLKNECEKFLQDFKFI